MNGASYGRFSELSSVANRSNLDPSPMALAVPSDVRSSRLSMGSHQHHQQMNGFYGGGPSWISAGNQLRDDSQHYFKPLNIGIGGSLINGHQYQLQHQEDMALNGATNGFHDAYGMMGTLFNNGDRYDNIYGISPYAEGFKGQLLRQKPDYLQKEQVESRPLTKQVDHFFYHLPQNNRYASNPLHYAPEFIKVFSDLRIVEGGTAVFDCVLFGSPRPKVCWLFNNQTLYFDDVILEDTSDLCRITIKCVERHHYGTYTVLAENEVGRAITTATLKPPLI